MLPLLDAAAAENLPLLHEARITVDARDEEPVWSQALELPDPRPFQPTADVEPVGTLRTRLLADDQALYAFFEVTDPEPSRVRAGLGRRDARTDDDNVSLVVDPAGDGRRGYIFATTPLGVQFDGLHISGVDEDNWSWDGVWRSAGRRTPTGYAVEIAIPWSTLHLSGKVDHIGLLSIRYLSRKGQLYAWPTVTPNTDVMLAEASLSLTEPLPRRLGLEVLPEVTGAWSDPHVESGRLELGGVGPGVTLRYAPSQNFGAVGTFNPDFSQLESDKVQIDVNRRYALYYPEKRPFFLEGQDWFDHPFEDIVYTRSMNAPLYGVRASGQVGHLGFAVLNALDLAPPSSVSEGGGWSSDQLDGHSALASLARLRVGLGGSDSYVGILGSDRTILDSSLYNRVIGIDGAVRLEKRARITASLMGSATTFSEGAAPKLAPAGTLDVLFSGDRLSLHTVATVISPDFRQENGFVTHSDVAGAMTEDHINFHPSEAIPLLALEPIDAEAYWHFDGSPRSRAWNPSIWAQFGNATFAKVDASLDGEEFEGTWIDYQYASFYLGGSLGSWLRPEGGGSIGSSPIYDPERPRPGKMVDLWSGIEFQPVSPFVLGIDPEITRMQELDGSPVFLAYTARIKAEVFFTREFWFRTVTELSGQDAKALDWNVEPVAAWEWTPGRAAYLGGAWGVQDGSPYWQLFAKVGWRFAL